uniref:zinc finger BED domain-containing protein 5-like n=1 Tax=Styela clava TaxID=7725 RepID=UPI00193942BE|nr:zinc finger BED domain-containing protein 5-like [Styela clava]
MAKRKQVFSYNANFLKLEFTSVEINGEVRPQCVLCLKVLAHSSLEETKLQRYLELKHATYCDKDHEFFLRKELHVKRTRIDRPSILGGVTYPHKDAVRASFSVAWKIARAKALHTTGEKLVKPAAVEMARIMCGEAIANKLAMVPLSDNTIKRRIE